MFYRVNEERFHLQWRAQVRLLSCDSFSRGCRLSALILRPLVQLLRSYASDLYNPQVATVLGIILDITTTDCQSMAETQSSESCATVPSFLPHDAWPDC